MLQEQGILRLKRANPELVPILEIDGKMGLTAGRPNPAWYFSCYCSLDLVKRFGDSYVEYQKRTGALFPKLMKKTD